MTIIARAAATVALFLLGSSVEEVTAVISSGCCSQNYRTCPTWTPKTREACAADSGKLVWLPEGDNQNQCIERWKSNACTLHKDCCGSLMCDGTPWNIADKQCRHPLDLCGAFKDESFCNSRSSCKWQGNVCIPNFDYTIDDPANAPQDIPDDPACCSQDHRTCPNWTPKSQVACAADAGKLVWLPDGEEQDQCIKRWNSATCAVHEDCCGALVCDGMSWNIAEKQCRHPVELCESFDNEPFCNTRSSCNWQGNKCVPSFDFTVKDPANVPPNIPDDPGCCSQDHFQCATWAAKTRDQCKDTQDGRFVWIPEGNGQVPNAENCLKRWNGGDCTEHEDCCGSMICATSPWNALKLQCRHPLDVCEGNAVRQFCNAVPGCEWLNNECVPAFDYTIVDQAAKADLPAPPTVRAATDGNADYLGLCEGFVGSVYGDPHFLTFDRRKYDCQATGAFTLVNSEGQLEIQGMLHKKNPSSHGASVLIGVAIDYPSLPSAPLIQVSYAEYDSGDDKTIMMNDKCGAHLYIDGELQEANRGDSIVGEGYVVVVNTWGGVDIQFFDSDAPTTAVRVVGYGAPEDSLGCMMTTKICLPFNEPDLLNNAVGLLGTPNGNKNDEWTVSGTGEVLTLEEYGKKPYDFCTNHYCIEREQDSLFVYEEMSHQDRYSCSEEFPGEVDLSNPPAEILAICGPEDVDCLLEGILGGTEGATRNQETEREIIEIAVTPELTPNAEFNLPDPTPLIQIIKYSGPPGSCSATGVSSLEDILYTVPSTSDEWAYCYEITIPDESGECLVDVLMNDPAAIGGLENHSVLQEMCPGDVVYVSGYSISGSLAPEGLINATVVGTGSISGKEVTDEDPAAVEVYDNIIVPEGCTDTDNLVNPGSDYCPTHSGVTVLHVTGAASTPDIVDMLWDISGTSDGDSSTVEFHVRNPFSATTKLFVKYEEPAGESGSSWNPVCEEHTLEPCGGTVSAPIITKCLEGDGNPFTMVQLYFVDTTASLADQIFGPVDIDECCHPGDDVSAENVVQYSFLIRCSCPDDDVEAEIENISAPMGRGGPIRVSAEIPFNRRQLLRGVEHSFA